MRELLLLFRRLAGAALAVILMALCAPAFAVGADNPAVAAPNHDCGAMPAGSCDDMAACAERLQVNVAAVQAPQPAMQFSAPDSPLTGRVHGAVQMPVARVARYGPPAYLKFSSLLL